MRTNREQPQRQINIVNPCSQAHLQRADRVRAALARCSYGVRPQQVAVVTCARVIRRAVSK